MESGKKTHSNSTLEKKIPTLIQEQNSYPGVTTRWFAEKANTVCIAFEEAQSYLKKKCVLAGNPVRKEINSGTRELGLKQFGFDEMNEFNQMEKRKVVFCKLF